MPLRLDPSLPGLAGRIVLLLGAPRSGTTWLGKIFDSHPDVLYRHEPDTLDRGSELPSPVAAADVSAWSDAARAWLLRLAGLARLKSAGQSPLFRKNFHTPAARLLHAGAIHLLRLPAALPGLGARAGSLPVPELLARAPQRIVIKSVSSCGGAGLFAAALPQAPIVFLQRAPFGQIASMLQGTQLGKLDGRAAVRGLDNWPLTRRYGLTAAGLAGLTLVEQLAWLWVVQNETALAGLAGHAAVRVLAYHHLRADPARQARALFDFAGLDWPDATAAFIARSTRAGGRERYFELRRDGTRPERKWQAVLGADDRARIAAIVQQSTLAPWLDAGHHPTPAAAPVPDSLPFAAAL